MTQTLYLVRIFRLHSCIFPGKEIIFLFLFLFTSTLFYLKWDKTQKANNKPVWHLLHANGIVTSTCSLSKVKKNPVRLTWNMALLLGLAPSNLKITFLVIEELDVSFSLWNRIWTWNLFFLNPGFAGQLHNECIY